MSTTRVEVDALLQTFKSLNQQTKNLIQLELAYYIAAVHQLGKITKAKFEKVLKRAAENYSQFYLKSKEKIDESFLMEAKNPDSLKAIRLGITYDDISILYTPFGSTSRDPNGTVIVKDQMGRIIYDGKEIYLKENDRDVYIFHHYRSKTPDIKTQEIKQEPNLTDSDGKQIYLKEIDRQEYIFHRYRSETPDIKTQEIKQEPNLTVNDDSLDKRDDFKLDNPSKKRKLNPTDQEITQGNNFKLFRPPVSQQASTVDNSVHAEHSSYQEYNQVNSLIAHAHQAVDQALISGNVNSFYNLYLQLGIIFSPTQNNVNENQNDIYSVNSGNYYPPVMPQQVMPQQMISSFTGLNPEIDDYYVSNPADSFQFNGYSNNANHFSSQPPMFLGQHHGNQEEEDAEVYITEQSFLDQIRANENKPLPGSQGRSAHISLSKFSPPRKENSGRKSELAEQQMNNPFPSYH